MLARYIAVTNPTGCFDVILSLAIDRISEQSAFVREIYFVLYHYDSIARRWLV